MLGPNLSIAHKALKEAKANAIWSVVFVTSRNKVGKKHKASVSESNPMEADLKFV